MRALAHRCSPRAGFRRQTLTFDQCKEVSRHADLAVNAVVQLYFCDPHSPGQRSTCENRDGLLRQYLPNDTDLSHSADSKSSHAWLIW